MKLRNQAGSVFKKFGNNSPVFNKFANTYSSSNKPPMNKPHKKWRNKNNCFKISLTVQIVVAEELKRTQIKSLCLLWVWWRRAESSNFGHILNRKKKLYTGTFPLLLYLLLLFFPVSRKIAMLNMALEMCIIEFPICNFGLLKPLICNYFSGCF